MGKNLYHVEYKEKTFSTKKDTLKWDGSSEYTKEGEWVKKTIDESMKNFPIKIKNLQMQSPKRDFQVSVLKGALNNSGMSNQQIKDKNDLFKNDEEYEIVTKLQPYNAINSEYLSIIVKNNFHIYKFLLVLKILFKNTDFSVTHGLTSYANNIIALSFLQESGYLPTLASLQSTKTNGKYKIIKALDGKIPSHEPNEINSLFCNDAVKLMQKPFSSDLYQMPTLKDLDKFNEKFQFDTNYDKVELIRILK